MRKVFEIGGIVAAAVLIAFGIGALVLGISGRSDVRDSLRAGTDRRLGRHDARRDRCRGERSRVARNDELPTVDIAGKAIDNGDRARAFASYMRIHALESSGGLTYSQMGRFATADGKPAGTNDTALAAEGRGR